MEEEGAWQTVKSSNPKSQQRSVNTSDVKANRSKSNHQAAVNTISSKSNQKYDGRKDSESRKPTITSTTASAGVSGGKELKKPSTSSSSQPSANGRKLAQSTKKQGLALFDVLLSSKPSGTKDVVVSKVNATSSKSGTVTNKQDSLSSDPSRYDTDFPQTNSQISVWPAMNSIGRKDPISQSSAVTPSPNSVNIENRPSQPPSDGQKSPQKTLGQNTAPPNIPVPPTSSSSSQLKSNILTRQAPHAVSSISNSAFTLEPKRFVYRKKRIKKPSKLKKRILLVSTFFLSRDVNHSS